MSIIFDTARLKRRLRAAPRKYRRIIRNSINDTLRAVRNETPDIMKESVDRPVPFTARKTAVVYRGASYDKLAGSLHIAPAQARYLAPAEHGGTSEGIIMPTQKWATDKYGNVMKKFRSFELRGALNAKTESKSDGVIGRYFIGKPKGGDRPAGLYERIDFDTGLVQITKFVRRRRYRKTFGIEAKWSARVRKELPRHLEIQSRRPENQT